MIRFLLLASIFAFEVAAPAPALANSGCPQGFQSERTGIFSKGPRKRRLDKHAKGGRVCVSFSRPSSAPRLGGASKLVCPRGYAHERAGVFSGDSPKKRLLNKGNTVEWNTKHKYIGNKGKYSQRRFCLAVTRPGTNPNAIWAPPSSGGSLHPIKDSRVVKAKGILTLGTLTTNGYIKCQQSCAKNGNCVAYTWANKRCELFGQFNFYKGDRLASSFTPSIGLKSGLRTWSGFKKGVLQGKVDYTKMFSKRRVKCPKVKGTMTLTTAAAGKLPPSLTPGVPLECIAHPRCVAKSTGSKTYYFEKKPTPQSGAAQCDEFKVYRQASTGQKG